MTYFFETYGCQMNSAESSALLLACREKGWTAAPDGESADLVLINTCAVRNTAERRALARIAHRAADKKKGLARGKNSALVVAGCMAQRSAESIKKKFPEVDYVIGTGADETFRRILEALERASVFLPGAGGSWEEDEGFAPTGFARKHFEPGERRVLLPVMRGCDSFCSYCVVPYARGREAARDPAEIAREIRAAGESGAREITLLGQNISAYNWRSGETGFPALLRMAAREARAGGVRWLRFLSANPKDFSSEAIAAMAENEEFCRHLHLCAQHGSDRILRAMNRGYTRDRYLALVREAREAMPEISLTSDILVGFPGESEEDVEATLSLMEETRFLYAYTYHYNPMEGTAAFGLPGRIPEEAKRERLSRVIALQKKHTAELLKARVGRRAVALVEGISRKNADELVMRTERDEMVVAPGPASAIGSFAEVE
ncbi:MAG: tRNA (N6-isopentenyl adenosine(37)-C2)-methylthiotransferase MiaB, partial [Treponema sp.]|nr:tRNA (N6-isopentenyl adenosine(37)-C2)-methylthiotransferase MiaB [Treponema sp.]